MYVNILVLKVKLKKMLGSVFFQTLDETERGAGGFGSTGSN